MTKKQFKILITILTIVAFMIPALLVIADDDDDVGIITTVAGTGEVPTSDDVGDGGPATEAQLNRPADLVFDKSGNLYIAEQNGYRVRKVDTHGIITTVAGTGVDGFSGDGGPATSAQFNSPDLITLDEDNLYIADFFNHRIRLVCIDDDDDCEGKGR
jgi:trimeric autotransporter adhesin